MPGARGRRDPRQLERELLDLRLRPRIPHGWSRLERSSRARATW
jgi:hypothetical protein